MIELFLKNIKKTDIDIEFDDYFFNWQNGRDTTMMQQKEYYKDKLWFIPHFIFGTDTINTMPNWKDNIEQYIEQKLPKIFIPRNWNEYSLRDFKNYQILDTKKIDISSSNVKEVLIGNKQEISELIIPEIREYIFKNELYI
jgi:nicotinic acid mononucleotide adenylyltransferase